MHQFLPYTCHMSNIFIFLSAYQPSYVRRAVRNMEAPHYVVSSNILLLPPPYLLIYLLTYLRTYLLTYSMEQSPSSEAN
jgi:hypothetical protein